MEKDGEYQLGRSCDKRRNAEGTRRKERLTHSNSKEGKLGWSKLPWELPTLKNVIEGKIEEEAKGTR